LKTLKMKSAWVVDHDHSNGNFRGWVCGKCNRALGNFGDDLTKVRNAVKYLENYHG
jgi:hypothetical protein